MSANVESMAYVGQTPWHGLGNQVEAGSSTDEMLRAAELDWEVEVAKAKWEYNDDEGNRRYRTSDHIHILFRRDNGADEDRSLHALGVVGGEQRGVHAALGEADQNGLGGVRRVHDGQSVGQKIVEAVGGSILRPVGLAVAARIVGDAAEALAEVG